MKTFIFATLIFMASTSFAQLSPSDEEALKETKAFLTDKTKREAFAKSNPEAQKYIHMLKNMGLSESEVDQVFKTSSDIFEKLARENQGDPNKIQKVLSENLHKPEDFGRHMDQKSKDEIKALSERANTPK